MELKTFIAELTSFQDRLRGFTDGLPVQPPGSPAARARARIECVLHDHIRQAIRDLTATEAELAGSPEL